MKIEGISPALTQLPSESVTARVPGGGQGGTQNTAQDRTSFRSDSSSVRSLASEALQSAPVRQARVEALRQTVSSGQYQPDAGKIAAAISGSGGK